MYLSRSRLHSFVVAAWGRVAQSSIRVLLVHKFAVGVAGSVAVTVAAKDRILFWRRVAKPNIAMWFWRSSVQRHHCVEFRLLVEFICHLRNAQGRLMSDSDANARHRDAQLTGLSGNDPSVTVMGAAWTEV